VLTCEENVLKECKSRGINVLLAPKRPSEFKKFIKNLSPVLMILAGDQYHGRYNYIARNFTSVLIQGVSWNSSQFYRDRSLQKDSVFYLFIYKLLGLTVNLFNKEKNVYQNTIKGLIFAVKDKIIWGLKNKNYFHGGFSNLVFLQGEWEKDLHVSNAVPISKIRVTGVPSADFIVKNAKKWVKDNNTKSNSYNCDLLFFSQPLYKYKKYHGYLEELSQVVSECAQLKLRMIIKLHPRDDIEVYRNFSSEKCLIVQHNKKWSYVDSISLASSAKVIMGKGSTSLLLPLIMGKPVIFLDIMNSNIVHFKNFYPLKMLLKDIKDFENMNMYLSSINNSDSIKQRQNNIISAHGSYDGKSWQRIKNEIDLYLSK